MNQGGEPAHDDYGLPPVDIEIPDDARELDRDVQAYHRELRALRRHERSNRWRSPLRRTGMVVPLMAGCLVLAMVAGMVLTMFSANPYLGGLSPDTRSANNAASPADRGGNSSAPTSAPAKTTGGSDAPRALPRGSINVAGQAVALSGLRDIALAIVPVNCRCATQIGRLLKQAKPTNVKLYLVEMRGVQLSKPVLATAKGTAQVARDSGNLLSGYSKAGLVVVLVNARYRATVATLYPDLRLQQELKALAASASRLAKY